MVSFIATCLLTVFIAFIAFIAHNSGSEIVEDNVRNMKENLNSENKKNNISEFTYKKIGIRQFEMRGMYFSDLDPNKHKGYFYGYVATDYNSHDQYAVSIYNSDGDLLGYVPKGNRRLHESLDTWHDGQLLAWGNLYYSNYGKSWYGGVYIPIGLEAEKINKMKNLIELTLKNNKLIEQNADSGNNFFEIAELYKKTIDLRAEINEDVGVDATAPHKVLSRYSIELSKAKEWTKIIELEPYSYIADFLGESKKTAFEQRIKRAKKEIEKENKR